MKWLELSLCIVAPLALALFGVPEELAPPVDEQLAACVSPTFILADDDFGYFVSGVTGSAIASVEYLTLDSLKGNGKRASIFHIDRQIHADLRASTLDYAGSGYDIGHLAPDADTGDQQSKIKRAVLSNAAPQKPGLNRGLWREIEQAARALLDEHHKAIVVTMPLYLYRTWKPVSIGGGSVFVPTHFAKAALVMKDGEPDRIVAWLVENKTPIPSHNPDAARATVDEIERLSCLDLFGWLPDEVEARLEASR